VILAIAGGSFVFTLMRDQGGQDIVATSITPAPHQLYKRHKPRGKAKKRVIRNAVKRRRARKAGRIFISHEADIAHDGTQQVGFFG
jgi:hypothetical protein